MVSNFRERKLFILVISFYYNAGERLSLTLRFLATGETLQSLGYQFRIAISTACEIVKEVCSAIYKALAPDYLKMPTTAEQWKTVAQGFDYKWDFPHCVGAIDGKHVRIRCPANSGSSFYNYKGYFSITLLAMCDAEYKFIYTDVGAHGREGDSGIFASSDLNDGLSKNSLNLPPPELMPFSDRVMPYVIVGDEAFPLMQNLMRPYPGRGSGNLPLSSMIFNYRFDYELLFCSKQDRSIDFVLSRLSRARRVIENAFGILAARWEIFQHEMKATPESVALYTNACLVLHNMLITRNPHYVIPEFTDREISQTTSRDRVVHLDGLDRPRVGRRFARGALHVRGEFTEFFVNEGSVPWQLAMVTNPGPELSSSDEDSSN